MPGPRSPWMWMCWTDTWCPRHPEMLWMWMCGAVLGPGGFRSLSFFATVGVPLVSHCRLAQNVWVSPCFTFKHQHRFFICSDMPCSASPRWPGKPPKNSVEAPPCGDLWNRPTGLQRGSNGAQASPTSTRSQRSARLVAHSSSTPGLWWIPKISCPEDDTEALGGSIWAAWDGILHGILMGCTTGLANS